MTNKFRTLDDVDVKGKRVLLRVDLNVPMDNGRVSDATRLERVAPTITEISDKGGKVILLAHFGRPKGRDAKDSLLPVAEALSKVVKKPVAFADDCIGEPAAKAVAAMKDGDILCLENTRFHKEEEKNDPAFVAELAKLGDIWVSDAFSAAHRAHASTEGLGHKLPAYAGRTMQAELDALEKALGSPTKPVIAIIGGAKVSTKIDLLENLVTKVDALVIGGGMANTSCTPRASASASRWRKRIWRRPRCASWKRRKPPIARSFFPSTPPSPITSRPTRPRTPTASMRFRPTA
jgi:phosphoglycerate kinase